MIMVRYVAHNVIDLSVTSHHIRGGSEQRALKAGRVSHPTPGRGSVHCILHYQALLTPQNLTFNSRKSTFLKSTTKYRVGLATLRVCPFPVLGFWGKATMPYAGTMAYCRKGPSTTSI